MQISRLLNQSLTRLHDGMLANAALALIGSPPAGPQR
jgi:hypothetical protein